MLFQTLDDKKDCIAVYAKNKLHFEKIPKKLTRTWSYSAFLKKYSNIEYANLYCQGKNLDEVCPKHLSKKWEDVHRKLKAFYRAVGEAKLDLNEHCFFDMVPENFMIDFCKIKNQICNHVFKSVEKPKNYDFLLSLTKLTTDIKYQKLNLDLSALRADLHTLKARKFFRKIDATPPYVKYNIFGTKTGRLASVKNSFPILTMNKNYRSIVKPQNDLFIEFDYNAAELRTLLALSGKEQPADDLHEWNAKNIYEKSTSREEAKKRIFAWLYNPESKDQSSGRAYNRDLVKQKYWDGKVVNTMYGRQIESDDHHALNYIIQSTFADLFLRQAVKVHDLLKNKKSFISFLIHDSLVIDLAEEDKKILPKLKKVLMGTDLGKFKISLNAGKDFGNMQLLAI